MTDDFEGKLDDVELDKEESSGTFLWVRHPCHLEC